MRKITVLCLFFIGSAFSNSVFVKNSKQKRKISSHYAYTKKRKRHRGNGIDLKALTQNSTYIENPNNGVTPIETNSDLK